MDNDNAIDQGRAAGRIPFFEHLETILKTNGDYVAEDGRLLRNKVAEAAATLDPALLRLLLADAEAKKRFFAQVDGTEVFDKAAFGWVVENRLFLPDSFTRFKNRIGLADPNGGFLASSPDVVLSFPYKDCVLEGGQTKEDQKRSEVFYNRILAPDEVDRLFEPKALCRAVRHDKDGKQPATAFDPATDNLVIKGNNLLALASLLPRYERKIKLIYIDPPYNPPSNANTFAYNNSFNRSTWLVFMKNRLELAKRFLKTDGVMIVAIDKNEQPRLQMLIEEIFYDYDVDCVTVVHNPRGTIGTNFSYTHEFAIFVTPKGKKTIEDRQLSGDEIDWSPLRNWGTESERTDARNCFYPIYVQDGKIIGFGDVCPDDFHPEKQTVKEGDRFAIYPIDVRGVERKWRYARQSVESIVGMLRVKHTRNGGFDIELGKTFGVYKTVWTDPKFDASTNGSQLLRRILPHSTFSYPKSFYTVLECVDAVCRNDKNAIVLDFFGGSGTTGHAVIEMNKDGGSRRFILVEQMEYAETETLARNVAVMNSTNNASPIVYCELASCNARFAEEIAAAADDAALTALLGKIVDTGYASHRVWAKDLKSYEADFEALGADEKRRVLFELLDANMLYVARADMEDAESGLTEADKAFTRSFYGE